MNKIHSLSPEIVAKIAAGEVIERPVYAVKELVENALDAHADTINIAIEDSGLKKIIVQDNGDGMNKNDLLESFKLHTTSKLTTEEELQRISTLGFRGGALASIAAISRLFILSRLKNESNGTNVEIVDGEIKKISPVGMPPGTIVRIANLFHSVPGRKKFLKSPRTEFRHIVEYIAHMALVYPEVAWRLQHGKKKILELPKTMDILERVKTLLGTSIFSQLLPISYNDSYITLSGFLTKPNVTTKNSRKQYLFINKRKVFDRLIALSVKEAYGTLLESKRYPIFVLFISLPYELVDVNVNPRKEQVRFVDHKLIYDTVHKIVAETLAKHNLIYYADNIEGISLADGIQSNITYSFAGRILKERVLPWDLRSFAEKTPTEILQIHNLYLLNASKFGLSIVDQHAAHERILYEDFLEMFAFKQEERAQYHLAKPLAFDFSLSDSDTLQEHLSVFQKLGFEIEHFKDNTFLLLSLPLLFQDRNPVQMITEMLEEIQEEKKPTIDALSKKMIAYLACHGAVKAGDVLTSKQSRELLEKLAKTNNNATCPHGRPTKIIIELEKLNTMFKR